MIIKYSKSPENNHIVYIWYLNKTHSLIGEIVQLRGYLVRLFLLLHIVYNYYVNIRYQVIKL